MATSRCTATLQDIDSFKLFTVQGTGIGIGEAQEELLAKLKLIANVSILALTDSTPSDLPDAAAHAPGPDADATLTLRKGTDRSTTRTVNIPNLSTAYRNATAQDGSVNVALPDIVAFGDAYRDSAGGVGYTVIKGQFRD